MGKSITLAEYWEEAGRKEFVATVDQTGEVSRVQTERSLLGLLWNFAFTLKESPVNRVNQGKCYLIGSMIGAFRFQCGEWILRGKTRKGEAIWKAGVWMRNDEKCL